MDDKDNYFLPFPRRLRLLFDETRVSQTEVAEYVGVSRQAVSQWLNGKTAPDCYNFKKVTDFFDVPLEYLYGETDSKVWENMALAEDLGLCDRAIAKMQNWARNERHGLSFPVSEILSDIISSDDFDNFIKRMQLAIAEYIEHRFHAEDENEEDFYNNATIVSWTKSDLDNYSRIAGMRAIEVEDLTAFYKYQAIQYLEGVLTELPEGYYVAYHEELRAEGRKGSDGEFIGD